MTNRAKIMEELGRLSNEGFYEAMADNRVCIAIDNGMCADCKAKHGGICQSPDDDTPCPYTSEDWLDMPCQRETLLKV